MLTARHSLFCFLAFMRPESLPQHVLRPSQPHSRIWLVVPSLLLAFTVTWPGPGVAQQVQVKQTPLAVQNGTAKPVGHYDPTQRLRLVFGLRPPHLAEEEELLRELQDKNSPQFHKFLSQEEWNARFAPSREDEQAVVDWAKSQGMTVTQRYKNRLLVDVEAPAGAIEKAFGVTINSYRLPAEHGFEERTAFSNDRDPVLPARLSGVVLLVAGLDSVNIHRPNG